ncbi:MAG: CaiB/BaiF CoA-transferase family protein [Algiphilus sp.]
MTALTGLRVVELGGDVASAYCAKLLAGFGAEVLRVEHPRCARRGALAPADSDSVDWLDTGKQRVACDDDALRSLCASADLLIDGLGVDGLETLGVNTDCDRQAQDGRILVRIAPFGLSGPMAQAAASDITLYAASGLMQSTGRGDREPLNAGFPLVQTGAGLRACCAALIALHRRAHDGQGDIVEVSMQETGLDTYEIALIEHLRTGKIARRNGDEHALVPWRTFRCRDGWAAVVGGPMRNWDRASALFEDAELSAPRLAHMADRIAQRQEVYTRMQPWLARTDKRTIFHRGQEAGQAWTYLASIADAAEDPQFSARGFFTALYPDAPKAGRIPGAPFRPERSPWGHAPPPADTPSGAPVTGAPSPQWRGNGAVLDQPLAGLTVLDFTHDWAGPHAARLLADYGATVIKIEFPARLDGMRGAYKERINSHPRMHQLHRNKQSITLDLRLPEHREACHRLVEQADILLDNSRPGVMARKGLAPETLRQLNPRLIAVSLSAFGATGPYDRYAGYGGSIEAVSGLQDLTAYAADDERFRVREMDVLNGVFGALAALLGLVQRDNDGKGQWVDLAETETTAWLIGDDFLRYFRHGQRPAPQGNGDSRFVLQGCFACTGDDQWLTLTAVDAVQSRALRALVGGTDVLAADVARWCASHDVQQAEQRLLKAGIPAAQVRSAADLAADAHLQARKWWLTPEDARFPGLPFRFGRGGGRVHRRGPDLGQDNAAVLPALGLDAALWSDLSPERLGTAYDTEDQHL